MIRPLAFAAALAAAVPAYAAPAPVVFFDIAGPDFAAQSKFYAAVFGWTTDAMGRFSAQVAPGPTLPAMLRTDPSETVVYLGVDDINATLITVVANGGKVDARRMVVPGMVILALIRDPGGARVGLVEMKDGKPIVP